MALDIGELVGYLDLDAGPFESGITKAFESLGDKRWQVAGTAAGAVGGAALAAGLIGAINTDGAVRKMNAGLGLTGPAAEKAGQVAGDLYAGAYGESMDDVTAATGAVMSSIAGMRDASSEDIERVTASVLDMATAFDVDVAESAAAAGSLIKNGLAGDADQAMDLLVGSMQKVPQALQGEILPIIDEYGKHFAALGIDGETAMGMIVASSADGAIGMDKMGDALKEFTIRGTDMSKATSAAYETLGLNTEEMTTKLLAGGDTAEEAMGQIVHGLQSIEDPGEQAAAAISLFGTPLEDLGTDQIPAFLGMIDPMGDAFESTAGAAQKMGEELNSGPGVALEQFKRTAEMSLQGVAANAIPYLMPVLDFFQQFAPLLGPVALGLTAFAGAVWAINAATKAWAAVQVILNAALWTSPITWIIAGIIALIAVVWLIVANWEQISAWLGEALAAFGAWWHEFWAGIGAWITQVWDGFIAWIQEVWGGFINWAREVGAGFQAWWSELWTGVGAWVQQVWGGFINWIKSVWAGFTGWLQGMGASLASWWSGLWSGIGSFVQGVWDGFIAWIISLFVGYVAWLRGTGASLSGWWSGLWSGVSNAASAAWSWIVSTITDMFGRAWSFIRDTGGRIVGFLADTWGNVTSGISGFIGDAVGFFRDLPGKILSALGNPAGLLLDAGGQIIEGFLRGLRAGFENVKNFVGGIGSWIAANKGPKQYDLRLLVPAGGWIMDGLEAGLRGSMPSLAATLGDVSSLVANGIDPNVAGSAAWTAEDARFLGANGIAAPAPSVNVSVSVTEASNAKETGRMVVSKLSHALAGQGVKLGAVDFD